MISDKMAKALNSQLNLELFSSYIYLAMAAYSQAQGFKGFANWFFKQTEEESEHGMKILDYLSEQDRAAELEAMEKPASRFESVRAAFEKALKHEQHVTASIHKLVEQADEEKDYATKAFLQWFVSEQVEEESNVREILDHLKLVEAAPHALFMLDRELAKRE